MATLILGTIGRIVAGPIGAIVGTLIGGGVDRAALGGGRAREQGRISNPAVQSAAYGEPIPLVVGRMRAAGNLIWTAGIREASTTSGGGKRNGSATTSYSYSASFAVGLAGRRILGVERIWADGRLIRDASGQFATPVTMRVHDGAAGQDVDPLIAAAEGLAFAPAYRGLAYAVFEDMPLVDYGNRIPNLTFEIIADAGPLDMGDVVTALADSAGFGRLTVSGAFPALTGYIAAGAGSLADTLAPLLTMADSAIVGFGPIVVTGQGRAVVSLPVDAIDARRPTEPHAPERLKRATADSQPGCLELSFYDTSRDYQPGLQRARWSAATRISQQSIAAAMSPAEAKALAVTRLHAGEAARVRRTLHLSWRHVGIRAGANVSLPGDAAIWRVRETRFENFIVHLELEQIVANMAAARIGVVEADGGRAVSSDIIPVGETTLHVLDLPVFDANPASSPRLWVAGSGAAPGWRRAAVLLRADNQDEFANIGILDGGTIIGTALTILPPARSWGWDRFSTVEVELLSDRDWLEPRAAAAVLGGANLALIGDELVQFADVEVLAPRRFRLSRLLRGRRGTEAMIGVHQIAERFVLLDSARILPVDFALDSVGRSGMARPAGIGDTVVADTGFTIAGNALRPLAPVHLRAHHDGGDIIVSWIRRSRSGFVWIDFVDAPIGEDREVYRVDVYLDGRLVRQVDVTSAAFIYPLADRIADGSGSIVEFRVAQLSGTIGPGAAATTQITI